MPETATAPAVGGTDEDGPGVTLSPDRPSRLDNPRFRLALQAAAIAAFLLTWQAFVGVSGMSRIVLPAPSDIGSSLLHLFTIPSFVQDHVFLTLREILFGYAAGATLGASLGILITRSRLAEIVLDPFILATQMVPKLALAPLLVVWLGFGTLPRIVIVALITFFPLLINTILGIRSANADQHNLFSSIHASKWHRFSKLELPGALPSIFGGLKVSIVFSVTGAVVAEFIGGAQGLGALIIAAMGTYNVSQMFAILVIVTMIGVSLFSLLLLVERHFISWHESVWNRRINS